jgi:hypothetical protein
MDGEGFQVKSVDEMAVFIHELYLSFVRSGFTEQQALSLTGKYFVSVSLSGMENKGNDT